VYIVDLVIRKGMRNPAIDRALLHSFGQKLLQYAQAGIIVRRMFANISTIEVTSIAKRLGFDLTRRHNEHKMYIGNNNLAPMVVGELVLAKNYSCPLFEYMPQLKQAYCNQKKSRTKNKIDSYSSYQWAEIF
jgi:hypothetical protein